jgi:hypothetical protein
MENEKEVVVSAKSSKNKIIIAVLVLAVLVVGGYFAMKSGKISGVPGVSASVATVNGVAIPKATFDTQMASAVASYQTQGIAATSTEQLAQIKTQVLDNLISNELLNQGVTAAGIKTAAADVETQYQALLTQAGGADKLQAQLTASNMTDAQLRDNISKQLAVQTYLLQNIDVKSITASDAEVAQFYADYSKAQKAAGQTVPALATLSAQIKQQIISNKENTLVTNFIAALRAKATVVISPNL